MIGKLEAEIGYEAEVQSTKEPDWLKALKADGTFSVSSSSRREETKEEKTPLVWFERFTLVLLIYRSVTSLAQMKSNSRALSGMRSEA